jgi:hypothetical protein
MYDSAEDSIGQSGGSCSPERAAMMRKQLRTQAMFR